MKRSVLRIGCAVLSLSAAAGLLASCSLLPPASPLPDSKPAQAEEAPGPAAASLDDGKLRILYSNGSNGGNTVLCGNTVLYQAANSETVYLVPDTLTGAVRYYLRQWSAPGTPTGRATALCDRSGKEILTFDRAYDAALTGSLLVLTAPEQMAYAPCNNHASGDCRVIDLATGEELAVPENAYGCSIAGSYLAFEVCNVPADYVQENEWGDDLTAYCAVQVQDRQSEVVYQAELSGLSSFYASSSDSSTPTAWLVVSHYNEVGTPGADGLYNPTTGDISWWIWSARSKALCSANTTSPSGIMCPAQQSRSQMPPPPKWRGGICSTTCSPARKKTSTMPIRMMPRWPSMPKTAPCGCTTCRPVFC